MRRLLLWALVALAWAIAGCAVMRSVAPLVAVPQVSLSGPATGGDRTPDAVTVPSPTPAVGYLRFRIHWPERLRAQAIPAETSTIRITVSDGDSTVLGQLEISRPVGVVTTSATMAVPAGDNRSVKAEAFKEAAPVPQGASPIAIGTGVVNIRASQFADAAIQMGLLSDPRITSFDKIVARIGDSITITGANLAPELADSSMATPDIVFNGATASIVTPISSSVVQVTIPAGATCGNVKATVGASTSAGVTFYVSGGPTVSVIKDSWDTSAAGNVVVQSAATKSFSGDPAFVFAVGSSSVDFPGAPALAWSSTAKGIGEIDHNGLFTATSSTAVAATATQVKAKLDTLDSNAIATKVLLITIGLTPATSAINVAAPEGQTSAGFPSTVQLTSSVTNNLSLDLQTVTWTSSDPASASVSSAGLVTALAKGTVTVTARSSVDTRKIGTASVEVRTKGIVDITVD